MSPAWNFMGVGEGVVRLGTLGIGLNENECGLLRASTQRAPCLGFRIEPSYDGKVAVGEEEVTR